MAPLRMRAREPCRWHALCCSASPSSQKRARSVDMDGSGHVLWGGKVSEGPSPFRVSGWCRKGSESSWLCGEERPARPKHRPSGVPRSSAGSAGATDSGGGSEGAVEAPFDDSALLDVLHRLVVQAEVVADLMNHDVPHKLRHLLGIVAVLLDRTLIDVNRIRQHIAV
jgi:hypothetical protein